MSTESEISRTIRIETRSRLFLLQEGDLADAALYLNPNRGGRFAVRVIHVFVAIAFEIVEHDPNRCRLGRERSRRRYSAAGPSLAHATFDVGDRIFFAVTGQVHITCPAPMFNLGR